MTSLGCTERRRYDVVTTSLRRLVAGWEESDSYVTEIRRCPKKPKRIVYKDEIDGVPAYEPDSPTDEEQEENNYDIQSKYKGKQRKQIEKAKKVKRSNTKSLKM